MSVPRFSLFAGMALLMASGSAVSAADLFGGNPGSMKDSPYIAPMATQGAGWYFRLDGGYALYDTPTISLDTTTGTLTRPTIANAWTLGGGVGYHFSRTVRGDVTYDHGFGSDVSGVKAFVIPTTIGPSNLSTHASLSHDVVLANLYYDFDSGSRFTPYFGAGLGYARNTVGAGTIDNDCSCLFTGSTGGASSDHVAAAFMAGLSWQIWGGAPSYGSAKDGILEGGGRNLSLDMGYRFLYLGQAQAGAVALANTATGTAYPVANGATIDDIHAHEFRLGLRYDLH